MPKELGLRAAAVAVILVAFALATVRDAFAIGLVVFGIVNAALPLPGTLGVRIAAMAATMAALVAPEPGRALFAIVAWLAWPPAMLVAWAIARRRDDEAGDAPAASSGHHSRVALAAIIAAVSVAAMAFRLIVMQGQDQTAALFVGIPALVAVVVIFAVSPRSAKGVAFKAVTVGLLVSLIFLGEGVLCVLMSAPLFYGIALVVVLVVEAGRRQFPRHDSRTITCVAALAILPLALEGVTGATTIGRESSVTVTRVVDAPEEAVQRALFETPRFDRTLPPYLRAGFPRPEMTRIERGPVPRWVIRMRGGEMRLDGMEPRAGDLVLALDAVSSRMVRWRAVSDDSHMTHFLRWRESTVTWAPVGAGATSVTWTLTYSRDLDPSWYFGWWERYAASLAADYLITAVATP